MLATRTPLQVLILFVVPLVCIIGFLIAAVAVWLWVTIVGRP